MNTIKRSNHEILGRLSLALFAVVITDACGLQSMTVYHIVSIGRSKVQTYVKILHV